MRIVALGRADLGDLAVGAEDDARLLGLEVDGAPHLARRQQHLVELVELLQGLDQVRQLLGELPGLGGLRGFQELADLGVGEPRMGMDDRFIELVAGELAGTGNGHVADHRQAVHQRVQGAEAVGQHFRQHRYDLFREVHRVAAIGRLFVQRRAHLYIVGNVGDGDDQAPAATLAGFGIDGIVEVTGVLAVDGDQRQITQVDALFLVLLGHLGLELGGLLDQGSGPLVGDVVAAQGNLDLHARRHVVAQHLHHLALGQAEIARPLLDLHLDELAVLGGALLAGGNQHFLLDLRIVRDHAGDPAFLEEAADQGFMGAFDDLHQRALAATAPIEAGDPRQRAVTVEHQAHLRRAEEKVVAAVVGNEEAEAVAVATDAAADQVELVDRRIGAAAGIDKLAVTLHGPEATTQGLQLFVGGQAELFHQLFPAGRGTALVEALQDQLAAGNGVLVFFRLASGLGVEVLPIGH
ncbi:hypothetical protein D3C78_885290 [compost metagenome]